MINTVVNHPLMISASKTTFSHYNLKILMSRVAYPDILATKIMIL